MVSSSTAIAKVIPNACKVPAGSSVANPLQGCCGTTQWAAELKVLVSAELFGRLGCCRF